MKCALELHVLQMEAEERKKREYEEFLRRREKQVALGTIEFCENQVNEELVAAANEGKPLEVSFLVRFNTFYGDDKEFRLLTPMYPNSKDSAYTDKSAWMSYAVLEKYLAEHCISASWKYTELRCWNQRTFAHGATLTITA
jgi:hypothetical protein